MSEFEIILDKDKILKDSEEDMGDMMLQAVFANAT